MDIVVGCGAGVREERRTKRRRKPIRLRPNRVWLEMKSVPGSIPSGRRKMQMNFAPIWVVKRGECAEEELGTCHFEDGLEYRLYEMTPGRGDLLHVPWR